MRHINFTSSHKCLKLPNEESHLPSVDVVVVLEDHSVDLVLLAHSLARSDEVVHSTDFDCDTLVVLAVVVPLDPCRLDASVVVAFVEVLDFVPVDLASDRLACEVDDIVVDHRLDSFVADVRVEEIQFVDQTLSDLVVLVHCLL